MTIADALKLRIGDKVRYDEEIGVVTDVGPNGIDVDWGNLGGLEYTAYYNFRALTLQFIQKVNHESVGLS